MASTTDSSPTTSTVLEEWTDSLQDLIIPNSSLEDTTDDLGSGTYSQRSMVGKLNGAKCVSKTVHTFLFSKNEFRKLFVEGCLQLSKLRHPNLVQFLGVHLKDAGTPPALIFEFLPFNLENCLQKYPYFPKHDKYSVLLDVARGLRCLHVKSSPIVHGNLNAKNILLTPSLQAKISDPIRFGAQPSMSADSPYQPPEGTTSQSGDIFCFGDLTLHVLLQQIPSQLKDKKSDETVSLTEAQRRKKYLDSLGDGFRALKDLAIKCLDDDPILRPTSMGLVRDLEKVVASSHPKYDSVLDMYHDLEKLTLSKETIDSLNRTIQGKEVEIEALKQQMEPMKQDLMAKNECLNAQIQEVDAYKQALQGKEARIRGHESGNRAKEALIKAKDREIAAKKQDVAAKEALLRASHKRIEALEQQVSTLRRGVDVPPSPSRTSHDANTPALSVGGSPLQSPTAAPDSLSKVVLREKRGRRGLNIVSDGFAYQNTAELRRAKSMSSNELDPALANILARQHQRIAEAENLAEIKAANESSSLGKPKSSPPPVRPKKPRSSSLTSSELQNLIEKSSEQ